MTVRVSWIASCRRNKEKHKEFFVGSKGCLIHGAHNESSTFSSGIVTVSVDVTSLTEFERRTGLIVPPVKLVDSRASQLIVTMHQGQFWCSPSPEMFSRHSGSCLIIGDRRVQGRPYKLAVGDCIRLGSVGLVVCEIQRQGESLETITRYQRRVLKEDACVIGAEEEAQLAMTEAIFQNNDDGGGVSPITPHKSKKHFDYDDSDDEDSDDDETAKSPCSQTLVPGHKRSRMRSSSGSSLDDDDDDKLTDPMDTRTSPEKVCYMCYEITDTTDNPLVSPCSCKGDTKYVHAACLSKWYQSALPEQSHVIRTTGSGAPACKICGSPYKTLLRMPDGRCVSMLRQASSSSYVSLVVVTRHDTNPNLFNTRFQLNFGSASDDFDSLVTSLTVGRSSSCDMILDYRTVSTNHARIFCSGRDFYLQDLRSSNGTMVFVSQPIPVPFHKLVRLRMGRSTVCLTPSRSWKNRVRGMIVARDDDDDDVGVAGFEDELNVLRDLAVLSSSGGDVAIDGVVDGSKKKTKRSKTRIATDDEDEEEKAHHHHHHPTTTRQPRQTLLSRIFRPSPRSISSSSSSSS